MERTESIQGATILAFPVGGRRGARDWDRQTVDKAPVPDVIVDCDAWYHQAALEETAPKGNA